MTGVFSRVSAFRLLRQSTFGLALVAFPVGLYGAINNGGETAAAPASPKAALLATPAPEALKAIPQGALPPVIVSPVALHPAPLLPVAKATPPVTGAPLVQAADLEAQVDPLQFVLAYGVADSILEERSRAGMAAAPTIIEQAVKVGRGDTLMALLVEAGVERRQAYAAIQALSDVFSPRKLRPGQEIRLAMQTAQDSDAGQEMRPLLVGLSLRPNVETDVAVERQADGAFVAKSMERSLVHQLATREGRINSSLFEAAADAEVPIGPMIDMIRIYSFDVDFQRDIHSGDSFELLYESLHEADGRLAKTGEVLFARLTLGDIDKAVYRFEMKDGRVDYFDEKGHSVRRTLMRTPIDGARVSSTFGMRHHPVLGYNKMHRGLDFAAPRGTPIYAAGDGVVVRAGRHGGYGNYVRIRHNSTYDTAYAHMKGFAKGIRSGQRVRQGQVIGYVGSTGRSTGPHLHYEVMIDGKQANPQSIKLPTGEVLKGAELARFETERERIEEARRAAQTRTLVATASCGETQTSDLDC